MKVELKNCKIVADFEYAPEEGVYSNQEKFYFLKLMIPLPGGEAIYRVSITKGQYESLELAHKLSTQVMEKNSA